MFNTILNILDSFNLSLDREGQVEQDDGSIVYKNDAAILWNFEGVRYQACPAVNGQVWILFLDDCGVWKVNSKLEDKEMAIEFANELSYTLLEELELI